MSKENIKKNLEKVSNDQTRANTDIALAKENEFELTADDFNFEEQALVNDSVIRASGRNILITIPYKTRTDEIQIFQTGEIPNDEEGRLRFFEKASAVSALGEKLSKLKEEYGKAALDMASEAGFEVTWEDFMEIVQCLNDEAMGTASGGYNPRSSSGSFKDYA